MTKNDVDPAETKEWLDAIEAVFTHQGPTRTKELIHKIRYKAQSLGVHLPYVRHTPYINTIRPDEEVPIPGDVETEKQLEAAIRWNAMMVVLRATHQWPELGGHIATYASAATLYQIGFDHFFRAPSAEHAGDLIYYQGHASPGIYARSYLEGRLTEEQLNGFRRETQGKGISSYPHPWLMPDYWQFPVVSMGLGPLQAIYQARFMKYLDNRGLKALEDRKVWCFCGDGEMDEPESLGAIGLAAREKLDNLIFVINCNLQRLDGPVRGNGKIIQELEGIFAGAGWNVIKVVWGTRWDPLLASEQHDLLVHRMEEALDGDYQNYKAKGGAYTREHFFGAHPELLELVSHLSDHEILGLNRGGHDPKKVYAAYHSAVHHKGQPTVILAKTVKGFGMGIGKGEGQNITHQQKKMDTDALLRFRDRFHLPLKDAEVESLSFYKPSDDAPLMKYLHERRKNLGGYLPVRLGRSDDFKVPDFDFFKSHLTASDRPFSTTMAFVRILSQLLKDPAIGQRVVPIVPDEARTFGMEGMFRQFGIYASTGQLYEPVDSEQVMYYREDKKGQILEEGINEAGAFASWMAAGTSYSVHQHTLIPFYIYYSMFGFQRIGDLAWAAGDMRTKGFLLGATAGRTTLAGEGLQHQDGHSHLLADTIPNCVAYDPAFAGELAVIIHAGLERMYVKQEDVYFYITLLNENYIHREIPLNARDGILKGMYCLEKGESLGQKAPKVQLLGSGAILGEVLEAAQLLRNDWGVDADIWSVTSFTQLRREALSVERDNFLHQTQNTPYVTACLKDTQGPVIAASDYMKSLADGIRAFVPKEYHVLGTDGFGRSDTRVALRAHFEVDRYFIALKALHALAQAGTLPKKRVTEALKKYGIDADKPEPVGC